jgi:TATA-box binding protein (TBP) (component of TFIID and TFIIIB)
MKSIDEEWDDYMNGNEIPNLYEVEQNIENQANILLNKVPKSNIKIPKCSDIYISTKTKIGYLSTPINLNDVFWKIKVNNYCEPKVGVIKKQMKFNSTAQSEVDQIIEHLKDESYYETYNITHIDNPEGRVKFKDIRKISIGISKKDILSYRCKKKSAFYNCFVLILRLLEDTTFKEFHVKVFNTGKLEIPGVQSEESFKNIITLLLDILSPFNEGQIKCLSEKSDTVLINSNFNCGFYINREKLCDILKYKYKIQSIYDPCSYPGIQCKFYYNSYSSIQSGQPNLCELNNPSNFLVSFMIFRTGSVLIVGKCDEGVLKEIYAFIKEILINEYREICQSVQGLVNVDNISKTKNKKIRKKTILLDC